MAQPITIFFQDQMNRNELNWIVFVFCGFQSPSFFHLKSGIGVKFNWFYVSDENTTIECAINYLITNVFLTILYFISLCASTNQNLQLSKSELFYFSSKILITILELNIQRSHYFLFSFFWLHVFRVWHFNVCDLYCLTSIKY